MILIKLIFLYLIEFYTNSIILTTSLLLKKLLEMQINDILKLVEIKFTFNGSICRKKFYL